jgi:hypothetical protein
MPAEESPHPDCPECGASAVDGLDCWWQMGAVCAWEYDDPALQAVHFFTVACYNLQHPARFTESTIAGLQTLFAEAVDERLSGPEIRRRAGHAHGGPTRVLRDEADRRPVLRRWPMTVADVYLPDRPAGAAERVMAWAAAIRAELPH